jgi:hypothetical protein
MAEAVTLCAAISKLGKLADNKQVFFWILATSSLRLMEHSRPKSGPMRFVPI